MLEVDVAATRGAFRLEAAFRSDAPIVALFGRSGSGKTTLVHAIAGLVRAHARAHRDRRARALRFRARHRPRRRSSGAWATCSRTRCSFRTWTCARNLAYGEAPHSGRRALRGSRARDGPARPRRAPRPQALDALRRREAARGHRACAAREPARAAARRAARLARRRAQGRDPAVHRAAARRAAPAHRVREPRAGRGHAARRPHGAHGRWTGARARQRGRAGRAARPRAATWAASRPVR